MISRLRLLRNVGLFDSVTAGDDYELGRLTLIYAENGRGKTTLASILRSLSTGDPIPIAERRRLTAANPPYIVIDCDGGESTTAIFENNVWSKVVTELVVFDDLFVQQNVSSGLLVAPEHRQNLHHLILGSQAVALNSQLQDLVARVEQHIASIREKTAAIPENIRGGLSVDQFCALPQDPNIDETIQGVQRSLDAARQQDSIRVAPLFAVLSLPEIDITNLESVLAQDVPTLDATAVSRVREHIGSLGTAGETWVAQGMATPSARQSSPPSQCPFCAQELSASPIFEHYRAYFSDAYASLRAAISSAIDNLARFHGGDAQAAFERSVRIAAQRQQFWSSFADVPTVEIDTASIAQDWRAVREAVQHLLETKLSAPLDAIEIPVETRALFLSFESQRRAVQILNTSLQNANPALDVVKEHAAESDVAALANDLARLSAQRARHEPAVSARCSDYVAELQHKVDTERLRDETRQQLDEHRVSAFPAFQTALNRYLSTFSAGFRLGNVESQNIRGGSTCTYDVVIDNVAVPVSGEFQPGEPSFRSTLSAGDRCTLALAFFLSSLEQESSIEQKIVVIDDPLSSLDQNRALTTAQEIRSLCEKVSQVIVLSHNKPFLCNVWQASAPVESRIALQLVREASGSTFQQWDVSQDSITEHDRLHAVLREYAVSQGANQRSVAQAIRPLLEGFLRVAYPADFPPETLLGTFKNLCIQRVGAQEQILDDASIEELAHLTEYANKFHHDTNPAWQTEVINDGELLSYVRRALVFAQRENRRPA